jgi:MHS family alpha-ketoglutarate permease-like MFS transporter
VGRKPLLIVFGAGFTVLTVPLLGLLRNSFWNLLLISCAGMVLLTCYTAVSGAVMAELFPAAVRTTGIGLPYALTVAAFGGTAPYLATALIDRGHADWFGWYVSGLAFLSTLVYIGMRETKGTALR